MNPRGGLLMTLALAVVLAGCLAQGNPPATAPTPSPADAEATWCENPSSGGVSAWRPYAEDPDHPWNRVSRALLERTDTPARTAAPDSLDPLLWDQTVHNLEPVSSREVTRRLDQLLASPRRADPVEPAIRARFQRELWAVFDWTLQRDEPYGEARRLLRQRLADAIRRVALPREEILTLPDSLGITLESGLLLGDYPGDPTVPYFPEDLGAPATGWVLLGRGAGPLAMTHVESAPFFGRSVFLVYLRAPGGSAATRQIVERLNRERGSRTLSTLDLTGVEVALVRRALLIDDQGDPILSPITESVQLRRFNPLPSYYQFDWALPVPADPNTGLCPTERAFVLFFSPGADPFESGFDAQAEVPELCRGCHAGSDVAGVSSLISYSRARFELPGGVFPELLPTTVESEAEATIRWKINHATFRGLVRLWASRPE